MHKAHNHEDPRVRIVLDYLPRHIGEQRSAQAAAERAGLLLTLRNREDRSGLVARFEAAA